MAPFKPKPAKEERSKKNTTTKPNGVVKRPGRGFHRFRDGMLNVTPKGEEKKLVESNQKSPLLRLPAEIRNEIWALVLGGQIIRMTDFRLKTWIKGDRFPLLRVCRQIYSEAVHLPVQKNLIRARAPFWMVKALGKLKTYQRAHIKQLYMKIPKSSSWPQLSEKDLRVLKEMRNLKSVRVRGDGWVVMTSTFKRRLRRMVSSIFHHIDGRDGRVKILIFEPRSRDTAVVRSL